ncbi:TetR/AcrR family transcriptional regulator [Proteiniclasticum sp. SCR006]|uniref:TetR/AcrR family transcriptional regulator n=1 Tax=Proteiniclasticum aestuarii TaxID=2817862 RepID=A0A939HC70_9CLOT|nr:TetR/AcrR family transcriptional regulator [Proteiniclasticum aestuarii]MBO1265286.1 TetR/AcrR family transcriptional regulator [Proteiniclasticum aestuarii]
MNDTIQKIIEAAYIKFMEKGYKATKTAEIAEAAEVNESTLFRNFKNKETLFQSSIEHNLRRVMSVDFDIMDYSGDLWTDLHRMIEVIFILSLELIPSYRLLVKISLVKKEILENIEKELADQKNIFCHYLQGMQSRNMIREADANIVIDFIYSRIFVDAFDYLIRKESSDDEGELENRVSHLTDIFSDLLRGESNERNH